MLNKWYLIKVNGGYINPKDGQPCQHPYMVTKEYKEKSYLPSLFFERVVNLENISGKVFFEDDSSVENFQEDTNNFFTRMEDLSELSVESPPIESAKGEYETLSGFIIDVGKVMEWVSPILAGILGVVFLIGIIWGVSALVYYNFKPLTAEALIIYEDFMKDLTVIKDSIRLERESVR